MSQTLEKTKGIEVLKEACAACGEAIAVRKGRMIVKDEARVVSSWLLCLSHTSCEPKLIPFSGTCTHGPAYRLVPRLIEAEFIEGAASIGGCWRHKRQTYVI